MTLKDDIIKLINVAYRQDKFVDDFTGAVTSVMNAINQFCQSVHDNIYFDTLDIDGVRWWEDLLAITPILTQTIDDRRSRIKAKWSSNGHNDIDLLQDVCNSWKNGDVAVDFVGGKIEIRFLSGLGIPADLDTLKKAIEEIKPAHLPYLLLYNYLFKKDIHHILTKSQMQTYKKHQYCNVGV